MKELPVPNDCKRWRTRQKSGTNTEGWPVGAGPPFRASQLRRVARPCRVFCDRAGILTSYPHHDSIPSLFHGGWRLAHPTVLSLKGAPSKLRLGGNVEDKAVESLLTSLVTIEVSAKRTAVAWSLTICCAGITWARLADFLKSRHQLLCCQDFTSNSITLKTLAGNQP
jgi:hypothetical protein